MQTITLDATPFRGRLSSPGTNAVLTSNCTRCGTSLAKRRVGTRQTTVENVAVYVDRYVCPCGRGREVKRPR